MQISLTPEQVQHVLDTFIEYLEERDQRVCHEDLGTNSGDWHVAWEWEDGCPIAHAEEISRRLGEKA